MAEMDSQPFIASSNPFQGLLTHMAPLNATFVLILNEIDALASIIQIPNSCSWTWRQILHARDWCKHHIRWRIGNGESSFLWQDNWLPSGSEIGNIISPRQLALTGLSWNAKVAEIVRGRAWQFPTGVPSLDTVWQSIDYLPNYNQDDTFFWKGTSSGMYTIQSAWEITRPHHNTCLAHDFNWHVGHIPRQAFMLWLTFNQRLQTLDRVQRFMGPSASTTCVLCGGVEESHDHLFFLCRFSSKIWKSLNTRARIHWPNLPWSRLKFWAIGRYRNKRKTKFIIPKLLLASAIYHIWYERNRRSFNNQFTPAKTVEEDIFQLIRAHLINGVKVDELPPAQRLIWEV
ncbi:hypothetical protein DKX38_011738 [Salix brachista]|uniref:Reverse transcriptase zinc-binding domain-containing protein n=1 Tax=Salix brachista TaxID=2182728 RepID=A0A5N5M002_9ROSI|nr:hypothetical protein DKX38_011738 [Salix brachista]